MAQIDNMRPRAYFSDFSRSDGGNDEYKFGKGVLDGFSDATQCHDEDGAIAQVFFFWFSMV